MIELGQHVQYIVGAYTGVALVVAGLVAVTVRDARVQKTRLDDLEARGIRRQSGTGADPK